MDDAGVVQAGGQFIVCTVDGMHSRLSDFPYLAGFHVTRATLRDCYVMGARPVMLFLTSMLLMMVMLRKFLIILLE